MILEARIEADGTVSRTRVLRSIPMLDDAAEEAVSQWQFTPTLLNGHAVADCDDGYGELHVAVSAIQSATAQPSNYQAEKLRTVDSIVLSWNSRIGGCDFSAGRLAGCRSPHTRASSTITSTAFSMSCTDTHSSRE